VSGTDRVVTEAAPRWQNLPELNRRWVLLNAVVATAAINAVVNAALAWLTAVGKGPVPLWAAPLSGPSTGLDTVTTLFFLPLITCVLCSAAVRRDMRLGNLPPLDRTYLPGFLARTPEGLLQRGLVFGGCMTAALGPVAVLCLVAADFGDISVGTFVVYKAVLGVGLGLLVTPLIALRAMVDAPSSSAAAL